MGLIGSLDYEDDVCGAQTAGNWVEDRNVTLYVLY